MRGVKAGSNATFVINGTIVIVHDQRKVLYISSNFLSSSLSKRNIVFIIFYFLILIT